MTCATIPDSTNSSTPPVYGNPGRRPPVSRARFARAAALTWIDRQRASNVQQGFVAPPGLCERAAKIAVGYRRSRRKVDRLPQVCDRIVETACSKQQHAKLIVRVGEVRIQREGAFKGAHRLVAGARSCQRFAKIELQVGIVRRQVGRTLEVAYGFRRPAGFEQRASKFVAGPRRPWIQGDRTLERCDAVGDTPHVHIARAQKRQVLRTWRRLHPRLGNRHIAGPVTRGQIVEQAAPILGRRGHDLQQQIAHLVRRSRAGGHPHRRMVRVVRVAVRVVVREAHVDCRASAAN